MGGQREFIKRHKANKKHDTEWAKGAPSKDHTTPPSNFNARGGPCQGPGWTSSRSSTVSELMSSLRRRPQINRALHWPNANHLHATLRATFHRRRVRPTRATTTGRRTACSSWLARSRASTGADLREVGRHNAICASSGHHQLNGAARCVVDTI